MCMYVYIYIYIYIYGEGSVVVGGPPESIPCSDGEEEAAFEARAKSDMRLLRVRGPSLPECQVIRMR